MAHILAGIPPYQLTLAKTAIKIFDLGATKPPQPWCLILAVVAETAPAAKKEAVTAVGVAASEIS